MKHEEHRQKHIELHRALEDLIDDYIKHHNVLRDDAKIMDLIRWSFEQTIEPEE